MTRFVVGVLTPFLILCGWLGWSVGRFGVLRWSEITALAITLLVIPAVSACLAVAIVETVRRRRLVKRSDRRIVRMVFGLVTGLTSLGISAYFIGKPGQDSPDPLIVAVAVFVVSLAIVSVMPGLRSGVCRGCGYDIRGSLDFGRCPECSAIIGP